MKIDDDTLKQLSRINDELLQLCKFLNEKRDMETSSHLITLVDDLTHILIGGLGIPAFLTATWCTQKSEA
jgi:hypothetical protein